MKFSKTIFLSSFIIFLIGFVLLSGVAAALPNSIDDGNHFFQEITVSADSAKNDALIHLWIPYPYDFSGAWDSYRFYDDSGSLLPFHVFNGNDTHASVSIQIDLSSGENTIWMTAGNASLENAGTTGVYGSYDDFDAKPNGQTQYHNRSVESYNFAQMKATPYLDYGTSWLEVKFGDQRFYYYFRNSSSNYMQYWWNGSNATSGSVTLGGNVNSSSANINIFLAADGTLNGTNLSSQTATPHYTYQQYGYYNQLASSPMSLFSNSVNISMSSQLNGSVTDPRHSHVITATGLYSVVDVTFGDVNVITENINGFYLRTVDGIDGNIIRLSSGYPSSLVLGGNTYATGITKVFFQAGLLYNWFKATATTSDGSDSYAIMNPTATEMVPQSLTSVVFIPDISDGDVLIDFKPINTSKNTGVLPAANANEYTIRLSPSNSIITVPLTTNATQANNGAGIFGQIVDGSGNPIDNVTVNYMNYSSGSFINSTTSVAGGMFGYSPNVASATFYLTFSKPGYASNSTIGTTGGANSSAFVGVVVMEKLHNISISVIDDSGNPVQSFTTFLGPTQIIRSTDNGTVHYQNIEGGELDVIIQADGFSQVSRSIFVGENSTEFTISLRSTPATEFITPFFATFHIKNQFTNYVKGTTVIIKNADTGSEVFNRTLTNTGYFTVRLDRTVHYTVQVIKESAGINKSFNIFGANDGDVFTIVVFENQTQQEIGGLIDSVRVSYTLLPVVGDVAQLVVNYSSLRGVPVVQNGSGSAEYRILSGANSGTGSIPQSNVTITASGFTVTYNISSELYTRMKDGSAVISVHQNVTKSDAFEVSGRMDTSVSVRSTFNILNLPFTDVQKNAVSLFLIFLISIIMSTASNVSYSSASGAVTALILTGVGWLNFGIMISVLLALGIIVVIYHDIKVKG